LLGSAKDHFDMFRLFCSAKIDLPREKRGREQMLERIGV